jgi:hypothetical protein
VARDLVDAAADHAVWMQSRKFSCLMIMESLNATVPGEVPAATAAAASDQALHLLLHE